MCWRPVSNVARGYSNLELDLASGKRGGRLDGIRESLRLLLDCEDAVVVNNNAAAVMLMLAASTTESTLVMVRSLVVSFQNAMRKGADPVYERDSHSSFDVHE